MKILLLAAVLLEVLLVLFYMFSPLVKSGKRNLAAKTSCSVLFVAIAVLAAKASGGYTTYGAWMTAGAVCGALGDIILKMDVKSPRFFAGLCSFLVGHIFYATAFTSQLCTLTSVQTVLLIASIAALSLAIFLFGKRLRIKPGKALLPLTLYVFAICTMLVSAWAAVCVSAHTVGAALCVLLGAALFTASDATLGLRTFAKDKVYVHRLSTPITYFSAQTLLALSICFVR